MRWACMLVIAACIEPAVVVCDNGTACPAGTLCDLAHHGCAFADQFAACANRGDNSTCMAPTVPNGACHDGVCLPIACGNGLVDPGEVCDDGNAIAGDGCAADCASDEACGNGVIDLIHGEQCDDANLRSHDGCDSRCRPEQLAWRRWLQTTPAPRKYATFAYDPRRHRLVVFGGAYLVDDTLEWDGAAWLDVTPVLSPPTSGGAMAFDPIRGNVVMVGGSNNGTWLWDGTTWTAGPALGVPGAPSARSDARLAFDPVRACLVSAGAVANTWCWNGTWTQISSTDPGRSTAAVWFDRVRGTIIEWGGAASGVESNIMSELASNGTWSTVAPGLGPSAGRSLIAYDARRARLVLTSNAQTWESDGGAWHLRTTAGPMPPAFDSYGDAITYDPRRGRIVVVGDASMAWEYDGTAWTSISPATHPPVVDSAGIAFDAQLGKVVLFGGEDSTLLNALDATWTWDGATWIDVSGPTRPTGRVAPVVGYDPVRAEIVMFGGRTGGPGPGTFGDTWGGTVCGGWVRSTRSATPAARHLSARSLHNLRG